MYAISDFERNGFAAPLPGISADEAAAWAWHAPAEAIGDLVALRAYWNGGNPAKQPFPPPVAPGLPFR